MYARNRRSTRGVGALALTIASLLVAAALPGGAAEIDYADFSDGAGLTINGDAAVNVDNGIDPNPVLRLTPDAGSQAGSAFSTTTVTAAGFTTTFEFRITKTDGVGADGIVFVIQPVSSGSGTSGGGIGYDGITPSVGVEFDTFVNTGDPSESHVGIDLNGVVTHPGGEYVVDLMPQLLDDGDKWTCWVDYNGRTLDVRANTTGVRPADPLLSREVDVATLFGQDDAYIGFTSATGGFASAHDIISWNYRVTQVVWDGEAGSGSWTGGVNWDGDAAPQAGDSLLFAGSTETTVDNDLATVEYASLAFDDTAASFTLNGNAVQIADGGYIENGSANAQTINLALTGNGVLQINAAAGDLTFDSLTIAGATTVTGDSDVTVGGVLDGAGAVAKSGAGTLVLSGDNTYAGGTDLAGGGILLGHANGLGTGGLVVSGDGALGASAVLGDAVTNNVTVNDGVTLTIGGTEDIELAGSVVGDGGLTVHTDAADDVVTLSGSNTYAGQTTVTQGVLLAAGGSAIADAGAVSVGAAGRLELDADETIGSLAGVAGAVVDLDDSTLTVGDAADTAFAGVLSDDGADGGALVKQGNGTLTLGGSNTYGGGTQLAAGAVLLGHAGALGTGAVTVTGSATLGASAALGAAVTNDVAINNGVSLVFNGGALSMEFSGTVGGAGEIFKSGAGTLTLSGDNTYSGGTSMLAGGLRLGHANALGTGDLIVWIGTTLGASGPLGGAVDNNVELLDRLTVTGDQDLELGGTIFQFGSLGKTGTGTLTLTGNNTYSGGTELAGGQVLIEHFNALGSGAVAVSADTSLGAGAALGGPLPNNVTIDNGVTLTVNGAEDFPIFGDIDGDGALVINTAAADDVVTLSGTSAYSGGTTVTQGILKGNTTSLQGAITNNAAVVFDQAADDTYAGAMDGGGTLTKLGAGALTLSGNNTYTGGTTVTAGTLQGDTTSLQGAITNSAAVVFDQAGDGDYTGVMTGGGTLTKQGAGALTLSGASPAFTGATTVDAGTLVLDGLVGGDVVINNATLQGIGTVGGSLTVNAPGTFAPGNSIGTTTVIGDYALDGTLEIEVNKPDDVTLEQDQVVVTGAATLGAASEIVVTKLDGPGVFLHGDPFPIITTGGGVTDNGATVTSTSDFLVFDGSVIGSDYVLTTRVLSTFAAQASPANRSIARAIDQDAATAGGDYAAICNQLLLMNAGQFNRAVRKLNAEPHLATVRTVTRTLHRQAAEIATHLRSRRSGGYLAALDGLSRAVRRADAEWASDPAFAGVAGPMGADPNRPKRKKGFLNDLQFFAKPFAARYRQKTSTERLGYNGEAYGVQFGVDTWLGQDLLAGLAVSYAHTEVRWAHDRGQGDVETLRLGPFATYTRGAMYLDAWATVGFHWNESERDVVVGALRRQADSKYDAADVSLYLGGGYDFAIDGFTLSPTASLQYTCYRQDGFHESGGGGANLRVGAETFHSLRSRVGFRLARPLELDELTLVPEVFAGWAREYVEDQGLDASFLAGGAKFSTEQGGVAGDSAYFGAGLAAELQDGIMLFIRYEAAQSTSESAHFFSAGVKMPL